MSSNWSEVQLKKVCTDITVGFVGSMSKLFSREGVPLLRGQNIIPYQVVMTNLKYIDTDTHYKWKKSALNPEDVVIVRVGHPGTAAVIPENCGELNAASLVIVRADKSLLDPHFLCFYLNSSIGQNQVNGLLVGSVQQVLNVKQVSDIELPLPSIQTQKCISGILKNLNNKIAINRGMNVTLEQIAQAIFKSWFVDFEPVKAKIKVLEAGGSEEDALLAAMQAISGKNKAQLTRLQTDNPEHYNQLRTTAELFPSAMQDSELGEIPEGWQNGALADIARFSKDKIATSELTVATYISTENMLENKKGITEASTVSSASSVPKFNPKQVLISNIRPYFKKIWFANKTGGRSPDVLGFESKTSDSEEFLYNTLFQDCFFEYMMLTSKGAKMPRGDKKAIMQFPVVIPCSNIMRAFCQRVKPLYIFIAENNQECLNLESLRDTLLPHLLSGQLGVHN